MVAWPRRPLLGEFTYGGANSNFSARAKKASTELDPSSASGIYGRGVTSWPPISRDDLKEAAGRAGFDTVFPELIRRLIAETAIGLSDVDMPVGSGTALTGFDGVITAREESPFVPVGTSVWELSVSSSGHGGKHKADYDYELRTEPPEGLKMRDVTYVEALLVPWRKARTWAAERTKENRWREVRGYNLDKIHGWLAAAPATTVWLADQLEKSLPGVKVLSSWWSETWLPSTQVPLNHAIVLAGRDAAREALVEQLMSGRRVITLGGDIRPAESRAFVAAVLDSGRHENAEFDTARALFVSDENSLAKLITQIQPLILLLEDPALARDLPAEHPHQLIMTVPPGRDPGVIVPRLHSEIVAPMLVSAGLDHEKASRLAILAHRSLPALQRALAHNPDVSTPSWAKQPDRILRRLLLIGSWHNGNDADRKAAADCAAREYDELVDRTEDLAGGTETPFLGRIDDIWHVLSIEDSWTLVAPHITSDDIGAFQTAVAEVLSEVDPILELDLQERWRAGFRGIRRRFSDHMRQGLARSLSLMATSTFTIPGLGSQSPARFVEGIVNDLLAQANADGTNQKWLSLVDVLSLLAEAAPEQFLGATKSAIEKDGPLRARLFAEYQIDGTTVGDFAPSLNFLNALETLAWSPEFLDEATEVIALLAEADPTEEPKREKRRTLASLVEILHPQHPSTAAGLQDRIRVLTSVVRKHPGLGCELLYKLLPGAPAARHIHPRPRFRDPGHNHPVTPSEVTDAVNAVVGLLVATLADDPEPYMALVDRMGALGPEQQSLLTERLTALAQDQTEDGPARQKVFEKLRAAIALHRENADQSWALPEQALQTFASACDELAPEDPARRYRWLFTDTFIMLGDKDFRHDYDSRIAEIQRQRTQAIEAALAANGLATVIELCQQVASPWLVGDALAVQATGFDAEVIPRLVDNDPAVREFSYRYVKQRIIADGEACLDQFIAVAGDPLTTSRILNSAPDPALAWSKLGTAKTEVTEHYWREFSYIGRGQDSALALQAAWPMLEAGRPAAVLHMFTIYLADRDTLEVAEVVTVALEALLEMELQDPEIQHLDVHGLQDLLKLIARHRAALGPNRVMKLEWYLFPTLGWEPESAAIHQHLAQEPTFFVELVEQASRPESSTEEPLTDQGEMAKRRALAERADDFLGSLSLCPGVDSDNQLDVTTLRDWVLAARLELGAVDRRKAGDRRIGAILANAPRSEGEAQVHEAVRNLLEELASDDVDRGLANAIHSRQGITMRGRLEGGDQERKLAQACRDESDASKDWPRTRKLLNNVARAYEADAGRWDAEAEREHHGLY
jgi:hypothetical protein